jgi:hypothetical protein
MFYVTKIFGKLNLNLSSQPRAKMTEYLQLHLHFPICQFKYFGKGTAKLCIYCNSQYAVCRVSNRLLRLCSLNRIHLGTKWKRRIASRKALFSASKD